MKALTGHHLLNDAAGNRSSRTLNQQTTDTYSYGAGSNRLAGVSGQYTTEAEYDDRGATTELITHIGNGWTITNDVSYVPSGRLLTYQEKSQYQQTTVEGPLRVYAYTPSAELVSYLNTDTWERWIYGYDPNGNMLYEAYNTEYPTAHQDPIIEHIYLGNRVIASVTGAGDACFIATVAYGSPLAEDLNVYRAFRDRVLRHLPGGESLIGFYYQGWGPRAASWIKGHGALKVGTRWMLMAVAVPLKVMLFGRFIFITIIFLILLSAFVVMKRLGQSRRRALVATSALALLLVIGYSLFMHVPEAKASYTGLATYYYTSDHIGRPFNLRDGDQGLRWWEQHRPFGETYQEDEPGAPIPAGSGSSLISWEPNFHFPGQIEDPDQSNLIHNHYREYMPAIGRYGRTDPYIPGASHYPYGFSNPLYYYDLLGLCEANGFGDATCHLYKIETKNEHSSRRVLYSYYITHYCNLWSRAGDGYYMPKCAYARRIETITDLDIIYTYACCERNCGIPTCDYPTCSEHHSDTKDFAEPFSRPARITAFGCECDRIGPDHGDGLVDFFQCPGTVQGGYKGGGGPTMNNTPLHR